MSGNEGLDLLASRRSIRRFRDEPVDESTARRLVLAACAAPSAGNAQPWAFVRVRARSLREALALAASSQRLVSEAPLTIVVCADLERARRAYGERGVSLYCLQDTAAATQNLLLAAHALGLGACWVGAFSEREVARVLGLASALRPVAIVAIGWPAEQPRGPGRRPIEEVSWCAEASDGAD
jgi:nitroreductase